mgnify:CR=1 FL=1
MLTIQTLEDAGYRKFMDQFKVSKEMINDAYKGTWQKCFRDDTGKKYFVNIEIWNLRDSDIGDRYPREGISATAYFQCDTNDGLTFETRLLSVQEKSVIFLEKWFEEQWVKNNCQYYEQY